MERGHWRTAHNQTDRAYDGHRLWRDIQSDICRSHPRSSPTPGFWLRRARLHGMVQEATGCSSSLDNQPIRLTITSGQPSRVGR